ncbi:PadR family transcriptional regulator [Sphingomonas sp. AR_OL41]|uniref:PadR family transcriptional regulator n=1 Tax=Sphingomonas sp. AR_OL41 TaxID=3042729 RepID=UPI00247FAF17|nr:PadR family transcriptional regulator [Sphingomonas sp. AR_OL41]MDH7971241.1 PadR family transcriptional regulator [Sphingomonas sp. AR_OL41]
MFHGLRGGHHGRHCGPRGGSRHWGPFEVRWEFDPESARGGRGGGGRRRMFDGGELRLVLLKLIADEPRHGYDLIRQIEEITGGAYAPSPGIVYPTLTLLDEMGLIGERQTEGAKKLFAVTEAGTTHLAENAELVAALMTRLAEVGAERARGDNSSVRRAMMNLRVVLQNRLAAGDVDAETLHAAVALIDEAAQKIERL